MSFVAKSLQCGERSDACAGRLLEGHDLRLGGQPRFRSAGELGKRAAAAAEDFVAGFESRHVPADRFDLAGHIRAEPGDLWMGQPGGQADEVRQASHQVPVRRVEGGRAHFHQYFVVLGSGLFDIRDLDDIRRPVSRIDSGFHWRSPCTRPFLADRRS